MAGETFKKGERVRHPKRPDWGLGEVLENQRDDKVHIFFEEAERKSMLAQQAALERVTGAAADSARLDNVYLPTGKPGYAFRSIAEMRAAFLELFPEAFADSRFADEERSYKDRASRAVADSLSQEALDTAIETGQWSDIAKRAVQLVQQTNLVNHHEKIQLANGVDGETAQRTFVLGLHELLYGAGEFSGRFDAFAGILEQLDAPKWTIATYFPALRFPNDYIFVKPTPTKAAADAARFDIHYRSHPNSDTYRAVLRFAETLRHQLSDWSPRDLIDIQSFMFRAGPPL